jgi:hypothetical protein
MYEYSTRDPRDPEDREIDECDPVEKKDKMMDKTVADTFPASDPLSSIPDPDEDSFAATVCKRDGQNLAPGNITPA